jgi:hypothetical protein
MSFPWHRLVHAGLAVGILCALAGCRVAPIQSQPAVAHSPKVAHSDVVVYLTASGWHTGIALPVGAIHGPLRALLPDFPGAGYLLFGWGDRDYYMMKEPTAFDALRASHSA